MDALRAHGAEGEVRDDAKVCGLDSLATSCAVNKDGEARRGAWPARRGAWPGKKAASTPREMPWGCAPSRNRLRNPDCFRELPALV